MKAKYTRFLLNFNYIHSYNAYKGEPYEKK